MHRLRSLTTFALLAALPLVIPAAAEEPANYTLSPVPAGTVVQNRLVYLRGEAMHSQWRAVASKKLAGAANGTSFYQWYLSIYAIDGTTYHRKYQSPADGGPLSVVKQATGAKMWFPVQTLQIVGNAELMQSGVQQLVVQSHETGADCGAATVTVFATGSSGKVVPAVSLRNGCDLKATLAPAHGNVRDAIVLSGPYYNATAPMCCPTKARATAVLSYRGGKWIETPKYFALYPGAFAPE
ncbi:MAG: hypothetical protein ABI231_01420 [Candidatus Tumulicola sp.]